MSGNTHVRLLKLEQKNRPSEILSYLKDGFRYIGGKRGVLRVPEAMTGEQWEEKNTELPEQVEILDPLQLYDFEKDGQTVQVLQANFAGFERQGWRRSK